MPFQSLGSGHVVPSVIILSKMLRLSDVSRYPSTLSIPETLPRENLLGLPVALGRTTSGHHDLPEGPMLAMLGSSANECAHNARLGVVVRHDLR